MAIISPRMKMTLHPRYSHTPIDLIYSQQPHFSLLWLLGNWRLPELLNCEPLPAAHFDWSLLLTTVHSAHSLLKCWNSLSFIMKLRSCALLWKQGPFPCREGGVSWRRCDSIEDGWELGSSRLRLSVSLSPWWPIAWGDPWELVLGNFSAARNLQAWRRDPDTTKKHLLRR